MLTLRFLSTGCWLPEDESTDTVSLLVNEHILVDTGWHCIHNLLRSGIDPLKVDTLLLTHLHQDHYLALPQFLFYFFNSIHDASSLTIYGPEGTKELVYAAREFAGYTKFYDGIGLPRVIELDPDSSIRIGDVQIDTIASHHAVKGLCYRFSEGDHTIVYGGDTQPFDELPVFANHADILIHECSMGPTLPPDAPNVPCHSSAEDAANCAAKAQVGKLYLVHTYNKNKTPCLTAARQIFKETYIPENCELITLISKGSGR